jgi:hypothetical protein
MRVVRGGHMVFVVVMLGRLAMVSGGQFVMFGGVAMMIGDGVGLGHDGLLRKTDARSRSHPSAGP